MNLSFVWIVALALSRAASVEAAPLPLTLTESLRLAETHSPGLGSEAASLTASEHRAKAAAGRLGPRAELTLGYTRQSYVAPATIEVPIETPGVEIKPIELGEALENRYSFRVTVEQSLLGGGALGSLRAAREAVAVNVAVRDSAVQELRLEVTTRWLAQAATEAALDVADTAYAAVAAHLSLVEARAAVGMATAIEVAEARARFGEAEEGRVGAEGQVHVARMALASAVGLPLDARIHLVGGGQPAEAPHATRSPAVTAADAAGRVAEAQARAAGAAIWPRIALRAGYQYENPNPRYFPATDEWNDSWDASIVATWSLDSGVAWNDARAARAAASGAASSAREVEEAVALQLAQQERALITAEATLVATQGRLDAARLARDAASTAYAAGAATSSDVLDFEAALASAQLRVVSARFAIDSAKAKLAYLHGTL